MDVCHFVVNGMWDECQTMTNVGQSFLLLFLISGRETNMVLEHKESNSCSMVRLWISRNVNFESFIGLEMNKKIEFDIKM